MVTSCENPVRWRRVLHLTLSEPASGRGGEKASEGLIADVSVYLCDEHKDAEGELEDVEPFPPD